MEDREAEALGFVGEQVDALGERLEQTFYDAACDAVHTKEDANGE